jgi:TraC protein
VLPQPIAHEAIQRRAAHLNDRRSDLYELDLYFVLLYEAPAVVRTSTRLRNLTRAPREALRAWLSSDCTVTVLEGELDRVIAALHHKAQGFEVQLSDIGLDRLPKRDAFRFFRRLVNYDPATVAATSLTHDTHLDYFVADSAVDCQRDHLIVGHRRVKVLSMKEPPAQTFANLASDLYTIPGEFIACLEWQRLPNDRMRRDLQSRRRHFFNQRVSLVNYVSPDTRPEETRYTTPT